MIGYATLGTNDIGKAQGFYDDLFGSIGAKRIMEFPDSGFTMYGSAFDKPAIAVTPAVRRQGGDGGQRHDGRDPVRTARSGRCVLQPRDRTRRQRRRRAGLRGDEGPQAFYGAYFRDLDGNKLCAFRVGPA